MEFENEDSIMIISTQETSKVLPTKTQEEVHQISVLPLSPENIINVSTENVSTEMSEPQKLEGFIPMDHLYKDISIVTLLALLFLKSLFDLVRCLRRKKNRKGQYPMGSMGSEVTIFDTSKLQ